MPVGPVGILVEWIAPRERQGNSSAIIVGVEIGWKPFVLSWWPKRALAKIETCLIQNEFERDAFKVVAAGFIKLTFRSPNKASVVYH